MRVTSANSNIQQTIAFKQKRDIKPIHKKELRHASNILLLSKANKNSELLGLPAVNLSFTKEEIRRAKSKILLNKYYHAREALKKSIIG